MDKVIESILSNTVDEVNAISGYEQMLCVVNECEDLPYKDEITAQVKEFIADELNHQQKLMEMYTALTGNMPKED